MDELNSLHKLWEERKKSIYENYLISFLHFSPPSNCYRPPHFKPYSADKANNEHEINVFVLLVFCFLLYFYFLNVFVPRIESILSYSYSCVTYFSLFLIQSFLYCAVNVIIYVVEFVRRVCYDVDIVGMMNGTRTLQEKKQNTLSFLKVAINVIKLMGEILTIIFKSAFQRCR